MQFKNLSLLALVFLFSNNLCMCMENGKQIWERKKEQEKIITVGERNLAILIAYIKNKKSQNEQEEVKKIVTHNIIELGSFKGQDSKTDIVNELEKIPALGGIISSVVLSFFSSYVNNFARNKEDIKLELKKALNNELEKEEEKIEKEKRVELENILTEKKYFSWFEQEIGDPKKVDVQEPEKAFNLICLMLRLAINNKEFFKYFLKKAEVCSWFLMLQDTMHDRIYDGLCYEKAAPYIEKGLKERYLPEKEGKGIKKVEKIKN